MKDEVDLLDADKYENSLYIDTMILMGMVKLSKSFENSKFAMSVKLVCLLFLSDFYFFTKSKPSKTMKDFSYFLKGYHLVRNKHLIKNSGHKL